MSKIIRELEFKIKEASKPYQGMPIALSGGVDSGLLASLISPKFAISVELPGDEKYNEINLSKEVAEYLELKHIIVKLDENEFDKCMTEAVKIIGRPIPHFNIFPLFVMYRTLKEMREKELVLGDGPDETMCGYARDLIITYFYNAYNYEAFKPYNQLIDKILPKLEDTISIVLEKDKNEVSELIRGLEPYQAMCVVNIELMRKDMDDMSNKLAEHFGIKNHRPYQDNKELDDYMFNLPRKYKIRNSEYGKYALRKIAENYLPYHIAWRKVKVGGPVYPVNVKKQWMKDGEFSKTQYLLWQKQILSQ